MSSGCSGTLWGGGVGCLQYAVAACGGRGGGVFSMQWHPVGGRGRGVFSM